MNRKLNLVEHCKPLEFEEEPIPQPPPKGAIIKVSFTGVCHSDVHQWQKHFNVANEKVPMVLGHEIAGNIFSLGTEAETELIVGERVVVYPWMHCGECCFCINDNQLCPNRAPTHQISPNPNVRTYGSMFADGGFQTHLLVDDVSVLFAIPEAVSSDVACLCACGGITALNAISKIRPSIDEAIKLLGNARVAIVGAGGLAQWAIQICKAFYGDKITICVIDVQNDKLEDAMQIGADVTVCWAKEAEKTPEAVMQIIGNCGGRVDAGIDFTGIGSSLIRLVGAAQVGASIALVGLSKDGVLPSLPISSIAFLGISFHGVFVGTKRYLVELLDLIKDGKVKPPSIQHIRLDQVNETMEKVLKGEQQGRAVVRME